MLFGYSIFLLHVYLPDSLGAALARILRAVNKHIEPSERLKPKVRWDKNFSRSILTCLSLESYLPAPLPLFGGEIRPESGEIDFYWSQRHFVCILYKVLEEPEVAHA